MVDDGAERARQLALAGELATAMAHEIKNPLAPIRGYAQMLEERLDAVDPAERALFARGLAVIQAEVARIDERLARVLGFARAGLDPDAAFEVSALVGEVAELARGIPGITEVRVSQVPAGLARGDADALRAALVNLVQNAAEAMAPGGGGPVTLRVQIDPESVVLEVLDEGPGLSAEIQARLFEPFATDKPRGTGLGLAIARGAARAADGQLTLEDREGGPGAVARLELRRG